MRFSKERLTKPVLVRIIIFTILVIILLFGAYHYGYFKKNCEQSRSCFDERFKSCKPAKLVSVTDNNYYHYTIDGRRGEDCKINIKLTKMGVGSPVEMVSALEGKEMTCKIPMAITKEVSFDKMPDILNYCTGPLKEAVYEQVISKMYALIIKNIGPIVSEIKEFYKV